MKKKKLALLLAVAMTVTSIDSTAMMVNAADFTSEEVQEQSVELTDEPSEAAVETDAETEDGEVISDNSSEDESIEITDEPQESADTEGEDAEIDIQEEEETSPEDVFSAEDEYLSDKVKVCIEKESKSIDSVELEKNSCSLTIGLGNSGDGIYASTELENTLTIRYADDNSSKINLCLEQTSYVCGNKIETYVLDADGNRIDWEKYENGLTAGKYTIQINVGDKILTCALEIKDFDLESLSVLKEGKQTLNLNTSKQWFKFTTGSKAEYRVNFSTANSRYAYPRYTLKYYDENNVLTNYSSSSGAITGLRANTTYIVGLSDEVSCTVEAELLSIPAMKSLNVKSHSPEKMTFIRGLEWPSIDSAEIEVTFDDDTKETLSYQRWGNEEDKYGRYLTQTLYNEKGEEVSESSELEPGNYKYVFSYGVNFDYKQDATAAVEMKVVDIANASFEAELTADKTTTVTNDGSAMLLKFTPSADGRYKYQFNAKYNRARILDSETKTIINNDFGDYDDDDESFQDYDIYVTMKAGKTYYLYLEVKEGVSDIQVTVSRQQDYKKLSATLTDKDKTYVELLNTIGDIPMEVALTTADAAGKETTRKLRVGDSVDGYTLEYKLVNKNVSDAKPVYYDASNERLTTGTWVITPCLYTETYDSEEGENIATEAKIDTVESVEITVASVESLSEDEYIRLTAGKWQDVVKESRQIFVFKASEEGIYFPEIEGDADYEIYMNDDPTGGEYTTVDLKKDDYVLIQVTAYEPAKIRMTKKVAGQKKTYDLYDGFDEELPIARYDSYEFTFKPTEDGTYRLNIDADDGDTEEKTFYSTAVYCDGERDTALSVEEPCPLKADHTYTYIISEITNYDYFDVSFNRVKAQAAYKEIKNIELVPEDDKEFNVISGWDTFQVKVTAADNTVEYFSYDYYEEGIAEKYGNDVKLNTERKDVDAFGAGSYEAYFSYGKAGSNDKKKTAKQTFTMPPISSYKTIALQGSINPLADAGAKDSCIYRFEAAEDADYILESSASSANICVYSYDDDYGYWESCNESVNEYAKFRGYTGRTYLVEVSYLNDVTDKTMSLKLKKDKTIKSVTIKNYPSDLSVYRGNEWRTMKINDLVVHVAYTDGSGEDITGLGTDSCGNMLIMEYGKWIDDETYRVYLKLDRYQIYIDFKAASADDKGIPQAEVNVPIKAGEGGIVEFAPTESGFYSVHTPNPRLGVNITCKEDGKAMTARPYLEKGKTYTISGGYTIVRGTEITVVKGLCDWEITTTKKATCTQEGESVYVCKAHNDYTVKVTLGKLGHDFGAWKLTKEASCVDGEKQRTCSLCNYVEKRTIAATKSHSFSAWKVTKNATVLAEGVQERTCSVCGKTETASVAKLPATIALNVKGTIPLKVKQSFTVKVTMGEGDRVVSWKTSNKKVVSVKNGKIKGLKAGKSATITVQLASGKKASFKVKVQKPAVATKSIKVTNAATGRKQGKKATLKRGQSLKLKAALTPITSLQKVKWSTSNKKIVTVSKSGVIKAKKKGKATITVKSGNKKYNIKITVK